MTCTPVSAHTLFLKHRFQFSPTCCCVPHLLFFFDFAGDPKADLAYERQYEQQTYHVIPEVIKNFLQYFHKTISDLIDQKVYELQSNRVSSESIEQKIYEIQDVYENRYAAGNKVCLCTTTSSSFWGFLSQLEQIDRSFLQDVPVARSRGHCISCWKRWEFQQVISWFVTSADFLLEWWDLYTMCCVLFDDVMLAEPLCVWSGFTILSPQDWTIFQIVNNWYHCLKNAIFPNLRNTVLSWPQ